MHALVLFNPAVVLAPVESQPDLLPADNVTAIRERADGKPQEISPYHFIRAALPPSIIFHGTGDEAVPFATVVAFQKTMIAAGNRCELKAYAGQPRGFFNPGRGQGEARSEATRRTSRSGIRTRFGTTRADQNRFIDGPVRFQANRLKNFFASEWHGERSSTSSG